MNRPPAWSSCATRPPQCRPVAGEYVWADNELGRDEHKTTPLYRTKTTRHLGSGSRRPSAPRPSSSPRIAILAQPADYLRVVIDDTLHTFGWNRQPDPNDYDGNGPAFRFVSVQDMNRLIPWWATPDPPGNPIPRPPSSSITARPGAMRAASRTTRRPSWYAAHGRLPAGPGLGNTRAVRPWVRLLQVYPRYIYLRGTLLAIIVLIGAAGVLARWRRWGGIGLLPWLVGALLIVLPPMTAGFSYRYVLAAVPAACLAAGLAFARLPGEKSVGALAADLRRHLGRGGAVEQE